MYNAENDMDENGYVREFKGESRGWTRLYVPNTVRSIYSSAYSGMENIEEVVFEDGDAVLTLYREAFKGCGSLKRIVLPNRLETIQDRCFADCPNLESVEVAVSKFKMCCGFGIFFGCPDKERFQRYLNNAQEASRNERWHTAETAVPNAFSEQELSEKLKGIFDAINDDEFKDWVRRYSEACAFFGNVDWMSASDDELRRLIYRQQSDVADAGNGCMEIQRVLWQGGERLNEYRVIASGLCGLNCDMENSMHVLELRNAFRKLCVNVNGNEVDLKVVFNRIIASLNPGLVVNVPDEGKLHHLLDWLRRNGFVEAFHVQYDDWFESSAKIMECLKKNLPERTGF